MTEDKVEIKRFKEPIGNCGVNIQYDKPPYKCGKIAYGTICDIPVCEEHWVSAKRRVVK